MAKVVIVGGGVVGLGLGILLAKDGHEVEALERDPAPPPDSVDGAWEGWERRGVAQFRMAHAFLARYRQIVEAELPELVTALEAGGAIRINPVLEAPEQYHGGRRPGDERFELLTGRRVMVEKTVAELAERTTGLTVRRGTAVAGLLTGSSVLSGVTHVTGVRTHDGAEIRADVVVDASGRRSALPSWLAAAGAPAPRDELEDSGFIYYGRHYRSGDGSIPPSLGGALQELGSISSLTLGADNGTWSVVLTARSDDAKLRRLKDVAAWEKVVRSLPTIAHWIDGEPLEEQIAIMSKIEDRIRYLDVDGVPVATGVVAVADAWACTNPSLGRGASIGMTHARVLRDCLRERGSDDPAALVESFATATAEVVQPWYDTTVTYDRNRLAEMAAIAEGRHLDPVPPDFEIAKAMAAALSKDPDCFRAYVDIAAVQYLPEEVLARPGLFEKVVELGQGWRDEPVPAPDRETLVALANS